MNFLNYLQCQVCTKLSVIFIFNIFSVFLCTWIVYDLKKCHVVRPRIILISFNFYIHYLDINLTSEHYDVYRNKLLASLLNSNTYYCFILMSNMPVTRLCLIHTWLFHIKWTKWRKMPEKQHSPKCNLPVVKTPAINVKWHILILTNLLLYLVAPNDIWSHQMTGNPHIGKKVAINL